MSSLLAPPGTLRASLGCLHPEQINLERKIDKRETYNAKGSKIQASHFPSFHHLVDLGEGGAWRDLGVLGKGRL